jgi:hypothetical protein
MIIEKYFSLQIYEIISIFNYYFINREVLGGVLSASQNVLVNIAQSW